MRRNPEFGLCSVAVLVVVHSEAQQAVVVEALGEKKKVTHLPSVLWALDRLCEVSIRKIDA